MLTDAFSVIEFEYRDDEDGVPRRGEKFWALCVTFGDGECRAIYETDRRGLALERLSDLRKLLCDPRSEWRSKLTPGLDALFGLWHYAEKPSVRAVVSERALGVAKQRRPLTGP